MNKYIMVHFDKRFETLGHSLDTVSKGALFTAAIQPELAPELLAVAGASKLGGQFSSSVSKLLKKKKKPKK